MADKDAPRRSRSRVARATSKPAETIHHGIEKEAHAGRKLAARREECADGSRVAAPRGQHANQAAGVQVGLHVHPGFYDETAAGQRPIVRHLATVAPQAGGGPDLGRLAARSHQAPMCSYTAVLQTLMSFQV